MIKRRDALALAGFSAVAHAARAQPTPSPVKIGVLVDLESTYADIGGLGSVEAVRMAVEDAGGSMFGRPIEVVYASGQNKPDVSVGIARQWFDGGVDMITDLPSSAMAIAVANLAQEKGKLALITNAGSSDITGKYCTPNSAHWTWDTYAVAHASGASIVKSGGKRWFFLTADYAFGQALERDTAAVVAANGGQVLGSAKHPLGNSDFSAQLLEAQAAKPQILGLANGGTDTANCIKQAAEFGLTQSGIKMAGLAAGIADVHSIGLQAAQGLLVTEAFYWDLNDATRAWSRRFYDRVKRMPSMNQAGAYSATAHYLKAVKALGRKDAADVMSQMRKTPINDFMTHDGVLRIDGRVMRTMYLFEAKKPSESKGEWDLYKLVQGIPPDEAFRPLSDGGCALVR